MFPSAALHCITGLRIGGSKDDIEIGGVDSPIIRDARTRLPYVPGSSLKGKLRSSLEFAYGRFGNNGSPCQCGSPTLRPRYAACSARITTCGMISARPAFWCATLKMQVVANENPDDWVEIKTETAIDRNTGVAKAAVCGR